MLGMAAVVVFAASGAILGPLVVGMCGALVPRRTSASASGRS